MNISVSLFFLNATATTGIYTLSLHDALPIGGAARGGCGRCARIRPRGGRRASRHQARSEEHTSELQSHVNLVCRLLLEKKKILDKQYFCIPEKSKILFFEMETPAHLYIKYKP